MRHHRTEARWLRLSVLLAAFGCSPERFSLSEVPIDGGTRRQRELVREGLLAFERDAGPERIWLKEIAFGGTGSSWGTFGFVTDRIRLAEHLDEYYLARVLRHELCHALDFAEDLVSEPTEPFDALAGALLESGDLPIDSLTGPRGKRREAFARYCDVGPFAAHVLRHPCPGEALDATGAWDLLADRVWETYLLPPDQPPLPEPMASWQAPTDTLDRFGVQGTENVDVIYLSLGDQTWPLYRSTALPWTGEILDGYPTPTEPPLGLPALTDGYLFDEVGWPDGPGAAMIRFDAYRDEPLRLLATDGGPWGLLGDGCVPGSDHAFFGTTDGLLWLAWVEAGLVSWAPVLE